MSNLIRIKNRKNSIVKTRKVLNAMELIASSKYSKYQNKLLSGLGYVSEVISLMRFLAKYLHGEEYAPYYTFNEGKKDLCLVLTSQMGLCGSYNNDLVKFVENNLISDDTDLIILGKKGLTLFKQKNYQLIDQHFVNIDYLHKNDLLKLAATLTNYFLDKKYRSVVVVYTQYINALTVTPLKKQIFPLIEKQTDNIAVGYEPIYDPNIKEIFDQLLPLYIHSLLEETLLEAEVSLDAKQKMAMKLAKDNADEIIENLDLSYNKKRQEEITNELNDVTLSTFR